MVMTLRLVCDGQCGAEVETERFRREFHSFNGRGFGFGQYVETTKEVLVPKGWVDLDPYTGCTYCPECWAEITADFSGLAATANHDTVALYDQI